MASEHGLRTHTHALTHTQEFVVVGHITSLRQAFEVDGFFNNPFGLRNFVEVNSLWWRKKNYYW